MKKILILGAGRSASSLIDYLKTVAETENWSIRVGDYSEDLAKQKCQNSKRCVPIKFDINDKTQRDEEISNADAVVSMLPARFHPIVAKTCVEFAKNMITASYVSKEMKAFDGDAVEKGILLLNECGLDPGIDHMSAMKVIDQIRDEGGELKAFESFTGGLLAPGTDTENPWEYKFTWNPRNVVLAGQGIVKFIQEGTYKFIPYHKLFRRTELVHIPDYGYFEGYANRDSLKYLDVYDLRGIDTIYRGTFRRPGFCRTWDVFVQLGATDDTYQMENVEKMTHRTFINSFLSYNPHDSVELKLAHYLNLELEGPEMNRLKWAGVFDNTPIGLEEGTPAQILEHILKKRWALESGDKDMIVMWHKFEFNNKNKVSQEVHSTLVVQGENATDTAMSKTVGLPIGIATKLILKGEINLTGVQIPIKKEIYTPILKELEELGFEMREELVS